MSAYIHQDFTEPVPAGLLADVATQIGGKLGVHLRFDDMPRLRAAAGPQLSQNWQLIETRGLSYKREGQLLTASGQEVARFVQGPGREYWEVQIIEPQLAVALLNQMLQAFLAGAAVARS